MASNESYSFPLGAEVDKATSLAKIYSMNIARPDGHWHGELLSNATITSEYIFLYRCLDLDLSKDAPALRQYLLSQQQVDGSWSIAPNHPGDISTTVEAYLALRILGVSKNHKTLARARGFAISAGGVAQVRVFTRFYLAMFGLFPWDSARSTIIPLSLIRAHRPIYNLPNGCRKENDYIDELWCNPLDKAVSYNNRKGLGLVGYAFTAAGTMLYYLGGLNRNPLRSLARKKCVNWILDHQEKQGDWAGIFPPMHLGVVALVLEGFSLNDSPVRLGLQAIERFSWQDSHGKRVQSCVSPFWDTVLMTIGLCDAGMPTQDEHITRAIHWLRSRQQGGTQGDWRVFKPNLATGGFSFEYFNSWYPDVDDTAAAVIAFLKQDPNAIHSSTVTRAVEWIIGMQNLDGGWGAFDYENNKRFLNKIPFSDMNALCDPSCADLAGRILGALGLLLRITKSQGCEYGNQTLVATAEEAVKRGIRFLADVQEASGAWYGRWGTNYIYGTSNALSGLEYFSHSNLYVTEMMRVGGLWLKSVQNGDGGWGESLLSYTDENHLGKGSSTPSQTAWALQELLAVYDARDESIKAGVSYLLRTQSDVDGNGGASWPEKEYTGIGFPGHLYMGYTLYRHYFPLMALGRSLTKCKEVPKEKET